MIAWPSGVVPAVEHIELLGMRRFSTAAQMLLHI